MELATGIVLLIDFVMLIVAFIVFIISGVVECITHSYTAEKVTELAVRIALWCGAVAFAVQVCRFFDALLG